MLRLVLSIAILAPVWSGPAPARAEIVVATRMVRAQTVLAAEDLELRAGEMPGALVQLGDALGREARVTLYPGRPVLAADVVPPALVERNQIVTLIYRQGGLTIATEGRALGRGAASEPVRAMNLGSRMTVTGYVGEDGNVYVGNAPPRGE